MVIFAIGDASNTPPPDGLNPIVLLFLITGIGLALGAQTACASSSAGPADFWADGISGVGAG